MPMLGSSTTDLEYLSELEELGEEIITDRRECVAMDRRRNQNREALRALVHTSQIQKKTWLTVGSLLVKLPVHKAQEILNKEQVVLDCEINKLRSNLKVKVNLLRDLEHKPPLAGFMLNPLSKDELDAMNQVTGVKRS